MGTRVGRNVDENMDGWRGGQSLKRSQEGLSVHYTGGNSETIQVTQSDCHLLSVNTQKIGSILN